MQVKNLIVEEDIVIGGQLSFAYVTDSYALQSSLEDLQQSFNEYVANAITVYSGTGSPNSATGKNGDIYIRTG